MSNKFNFTYSFPLSVGSFSANKPPYAIGFASSFKAGFLDPKIFSFFGTETLIDISFCSIFCFYEDGDGGLKKESVLLVFYFELAAVVFSESTISIVEVAFISEGGGGIVDFSPPELFCTIEISLLRLGGLTI